MAPDDGLDKRVRELEALNAVAMAVGRSLELDEVVREAIDQTLALTGADGCGVYLREPGSDDLVLAAIEGVSRAFAQDPNIRRTPAGAGWWGQMVRVGQPIILRDTDALGRQSRDAVIREGLRSAAFVPLLARGHLSGAIVIGSRRRRQFSADDLELLAAVGKQVGVAVVNARLFDAEQTRVRQLALINEIGQRIAATLDVDDVLNRVVAALHTDFGFQSPAVLLLDPAGRHLELKVVAGDLSKLITPGEYRQSVWDGMMGRCVRSGQVELANDVTQDPDYYHLESTGGYGSELCAPIKAGTEILGVLNVESDRTNAFDENDVVVIQTLADQLGIALQNARLFRQQERQLAMLQTLDEVARTISSSLDLDDALDRILVELKHVVAYDSAAVWLVEGHNLRALAARKYGDVAPGMEVTLPTDDLLFQEAKRTGQPVLLEDARADPRFKGVGGTGYVRGWVLAPLAVRDRVIGCLTVDSHEVGAYDVEDARTIMTFARHAANVLENARLYAQTKRQVEALEALHGISVDLLSRRKIEDVLEDIVRHASGLVGATGGGIYLYDSEAEELSITASLGIAEEYVERTLKLGEGLAGRVVQTGEPMSVDDYMTWNGKPARLADAPFHASISVPLTYEKRVLGALSLSQDEPGRTFDKTDVQLLILLAAQAAAALENARLYEELERLATHDGLTDLYNHRHFHDLLNQEVARASRYNHPLALLVIDLDGYKGYNDRHGHVAGDEALREIALLLVQSCRQGDLIARYGGEEFAIILPETLSGEALRVAERIRWSIEYRTRDEPFLSPLTVSIGVVGFPEDAGSPMELLMAADGMMYRAKAMGKNQVVRPGSDEQDCAVPTYR